MAHGFVLKPHPIVSIISSSTAMGYRASNVGIDRAGLVWRSRSGSASQSLLIDLGEDKSVDTITLHGIKDASPDWQMTVELATEVEGAFTGAFFSDTAQDLLAGATMPVGHGRGIWTAPNGAPTAVRYVRLVFSELANSPVQIARICLGARIQLEQNFSYGAALGIRPLGSTDFSVHGVPLVRKGAKLRGIGLTCEGATRDEVEALIMPFLETVGNDTGIALVVDPEPAPERQNRIYFGFLTGDLGTVWSGFNRFVWNVNLVAID